MDIAGIDVAPHLTYRHGVPVMTIAGVDKGIGEVAPMRVFTRAVVGRPVGYGSLAMALTAARNISRGEQRDAVVVERRNDGMYDVREAVWQLANAQPGNSRAPFRHFRFEDGSFSQYTAWQDGRRIEVLAGGELHSFDPITRWLVDGSRLFEVTR